MSNREDPLDKYENLDPDVQGDYLIRRERDAVRNFIPPNHPDTQTGLEFAQRMSGTDSFHVPVSYNEVDELPPVQVLLRGMEEQNTQENRSTIRHEIQEEKNEIRRRMNTELLAKKVEYEQLADRRKVTHNLDRNRSIIEEKIRRKSIAINGNGTGGAPDVMDTPLVKPYPEITGVSKEDIIEGFTSPGEILGQQEDLLYSNKFDSTRVLKHDHSREFKRNFRRHFEEKREREEKLDKVPASNNDPIKTNNFNFALPKSTSAGGQNANDPISRPGGFGVMPRDSVGNQLTNPHENDRYNKPRTTLVSLDSKDRDQVRYPDSNSFRINLGRQFRNVKRVVLISTEFPNTDLIVRDDPREAAFERNRLVLRCGEVLNDANNHLYWLNDEDAVVLDPSDPSENPYDCIFYTADLDPGNYTALDCDCNTRTLSQEIEEKVSNINHFDDGTPHQFIVEIDPQTNIVRFLSIESAQLAVNPFTTAVGTNVIVVSQPGHPFMVNDSVTITGATSVGGITASALNREHTVQEVTTDTYTIRVRQIATSSNTGGGANVLAGENKPIKLLFSNIDSIGRILGFPQQDSSDQIAVDIEFIDIDPPNLQANTTPPTLNSPGTVPARIQATNHGLIPGDEILIINTDTIPTINGLQTVSKVITDSQFEIGVPIKVVNNQTVTNNTILGQICQSLDTEYTAITNLTTQLEGNIQTAVQHNFDSGDLVYIGNVVGGLALDGSSPVNGIQTVSANLTTTCFDIEAGVAFEGTDISNAFVFQTTSTTVNPISSIIPQNNGVIEPAAAEPVFVGAQVPQFVFFRNMGNVSPDLNGDVSGIFQVDDYSESTGRFDLTTQIANIFSQTASQQYIRSSDASLRTITDAFIQSNGTFRLNIPHNLATGNRIYVRSLIPDITTTEPGVSPDITGIITVNTILNNENFDTTTTINSSVFDTGDVAFIMTNDKTSTRIQNIYPNSNNYLAKDIDTCRNPNCIMCENSPIIIKDSYLRVATTSNAAAAVAEETSAIEPLTGTRTTNQVFNGQSQNFTHIFDLTNVVLDVVPIPVRQVTTPMNDENQTHTINFYYDFSSIMLASPTTGTVIFGGTQQLELQPGVPYTFSHTAGSQSTLQLLITTLLDTTFTGSIDSGVLTPGTFYITSISFDDPTSFRNPLGNCFVIETGGVAPGTDGSPATAQFEEIGGGVIQVTTTFAHGLQTGDIIFIDDENVDPPEAPSVSNPWTIVNYTGTSQFPTFTLDFPGHDVTITAANYFPEFTFSGPFTQQRPSARIDGNLLGINIFTSGMGNNNVFEASVPLDLGAPYTFPVNTIELREFSSVRSIGAFASGRAGITRLDTNPSGGVFFNRQGDYTWSFSEKFVTFLEDTTQVVNVTGTNTFQITLNNLSGSGYTGTISYTAVCGDELPILSYFSNSWPGLFESQRHLISSDTPQNVYLGKATEAGTTTFPIDPFAVPQPINGYLGNALGKLVSTHPFESPLNFNFFTSNDLFSTPIIQSELSSTTAEFVNVSGNTEVLDNIVEITPANTGIIETALPHGFMGGERLYFLGNVNINNGVSNDLRDNFFEVASIDPTDNTRFTVSVPITIIGDGNVGAVAQGNFFQTPPDETPHSITNINRRTNGVFFCGPNHGLDPVTPTQVFITNNSLAPTNDVFGNAVAFPSPAPVPSNEQFDTSDIVILASDIGPALGNNKVDVISTDNALFPALEGMSWVYAPTTQKIPITDIFRDSNGSLSPVSSTLNVGDTIFIKSLETTTQDLNGFFTVSYIDLISSSFFELSGTIITSPEGAIPSGNIVYFRVPSANACVTINDITEGQCPTTIRASEHGFPIGSNISAFVCGTSTDPGINYLDVDIINDVVVKDDDEVILPMFNNGDITANLCVNQVFNDTNLFIEQQGRFAKEVLSTNCGTAILTPDPINHRTIVTTDARDNIDQRVMFPIINSTPTTGGASIITLDLDQGFTSIPWKNGDIIQINGQNGGNPYIDGEFKAFQITTDTFKIITRPATDFTSTGGTGGFATGPAPATVPGHGLFTGDKVRFEDMTTTPPLNGEIFDVTVLSANTFSIPIVIEEFNNRCTGFWCSNVVDMEIRDHGLVDGDTFFLYNTQNVGGLLPKDLDTVHGDKRMNIPTTEERRTQKTVRVIDGNNIQFSVESFPTARTLGGGFTVCISANNHTNDEKAMGLKNYGFNAIQTNQDCLGKSRRFIDLNNENYVLMTSDALNHVLNTGSVRNIFAKIQLDVAPGQTAFNSFVTTERIFDTPITRLDEIDLEIRRADGKLFDLRGRDYSLSILIEEYQDRLRNAEISSRRGIPDRGLVSQAGFIESTISAENPSQNVLNPGQFLASTDLTQRAQVATGFNA
jgi:hypothetical protein